MIGEGKFLPHLKLDFFEMAICRSRAAREKTAFFYATFFLRRAFDAHCKGARRFFLRLKREEAEGARAVVWK